MIDLNQYFGMPKLINLYQKVLKFLGPEEKISENYIHFFSSPRILFFAITSRCNFNCPHCLRRLIDGKKTIIQDLPIPVFETCLREGKKLNFNTVMLVGGEPILHPQFKKLIELIRKYNYQFHIISNGWLYKEYWEALGKNKENLSSISLSLDGTTAEVHDAIREKKGSFERLTQAMNFYKQRGIDLGIKFLLSKRNYHQLEEIVKFCKKSKVKQLTFIVEIPAAHSDLSREERIDAIREIILLEKKFSKFLKIQMAASFFQNMEYRTGIHFCSVLDGQKVFIDFTSGMLLCPDIYSKCGNKPLIQEVGFKKAYLITLETINELKQKRLDALLNDSIEARTSLCDYCDRYVESCLDLAKNRIT